MTTTTIRVGLPYPSEGPLYRAAQDVSAPILISAGSLYKPNRGGFQPVGIAAYGCGAALDSAGFVAMKQGGYRWTVDEYVEWVAFGRASNGLGASDRAEDLAGIFPWSWWSAMDYCCEPEIAADREEVERRIAKTVESLEETLESVDYYRDEEGASWLPDPLPILQGRTPADYVACAKEIERVLRARGRDGLPALVGVGSVCRRDLHGPEGLLPVLAALDEVLPEGVRLHLFGVKGSALDHVQGDRVGSIDSMAWDDRCRNGVRDRMQAKAAELGFDDFKVLKGTEHWITRTGEVRAEYLRDWYAKQVARLVDECGGSAAETPERKTETLVECPYCEEDVFVDVLTDDLDECRGDWLPCCEDARCEVEAFGFEEVFGVSFVDLVNAETGVGARKACVELDDGGDSLLLFPLSVYNPGNGVKGWRTEVFEDVREHHRHHGPPCGWRFGVAVYNGPKRVGVAVIGRPVARMIATKEPGTVEITRVCTWGDPRLRRNAASKLYGAACREAKRRGFDKAITYTLADVEDGASLRASNFVEEARTKGGSWNRPSRAREDKAPTGAKIRWSRTLRKRRAPRDEPSRYAAEPDSGSFDKFAEAAPVATSQPSTVEALTKNGTAYRGLSHTCRANESHRRTHTMSTPTNTNPAVPALKLSKSQEKNLARLRKVGGSVVYHSSTKIVRAHWSRATKPATTCSGTHWKANHKGFHVTAIFSLVEKGLVEQVDVTNYGGGWITEEARAADPSLKDARQPLGAWSTHDATFRLVEEREPPAVTEEEAEKIASETVEEVLEALAAEVETGTDWIELDDEVQNLPSGIAALVTEVVEGSGSEESRAIVETEDGEEKQIRPSGEGISWRRANPFDPNDVPPPSKKVVVPGVGVVDERDVEESEPLTVRTKEEASVFSFVTFEYVSAPYRLNPSELVEEFERFRPNLPRGCFGVGFDAVVGVTVFPNRAKSFVVSEKVRGVYWISAESDDHGWTLESAEEGERDGDDVLDRTRTLFRQQWREAAIDMQAAMRVPELLALGSADALAEACMVKPHEIDRLYYVGGYCAGLSGPKFRRYFGGPVLVDRSKVKGVDLVAMKKDVDAAEARSIAWAIFEKEEARRVFDEVVERLALADVELVHFEVGNFDDNVLIRIKGDGVTARFPAWDDRELCAERDDEGRILVWNGYDEAKPLDSFEARELVTSLGFDDVPELGKALVEAASEPERDFPDDCPDMPATGRQNGGTWTFDSVGVAVLALEDHGYRIAAGSDDFVYYREGLAKVDGVVHPATFVANALAGGNGFYLVVTVYTVEEWQARADVRARRVEGAQ